MKRFFTLFIVLYTVMNSFYNHAQDETNPKENELHRVTKIDGTTYIGKILSDDGREILIETEKLGKIYIRKSEIRSIELIDSKKDYALGVYVGTGVFTTRYQFTTNAFPIKRRENYAAINLYGPEVHFSVADNLSVGIMNTWAASPLALSLKYTFETSNEMLNFGVGSLIASSGFFNKANGFGGLYYGMMTYGTRRNNFTISAGYLHFDWNFFSKRFYPSGVYNLSNIPDRISMGWDNSLKGPIFGAAGSFALNDRVSIIFDMFYTTNSLNRYLQQSTYIEQGGETLVSYEKPSITRTIENSLFVIMPAMRFQKKENMAFQFSLSGVIGKTSSTNFYSPNSPETNKDEFSFPIPQCTWYFKF